MTKRPFSLKRNRNCRNCYLKYIYVISVNKLHIQQYFSQSPKGIYTTPSFQLGLYSFTAWFLYRVLRKKYVIRKFYPKASVTMSLCGNIINEMSLIQITL